MKKSKPFQQEIERAESLLAETAATGTVPPCFFKDAELVMAAIKKTRPVETPLALHFIAVAVSELLEHRASSTKIALISALALVDIETRGSLLCLFGEAIGSKHTCDHGHPMGLPPEIMDALNAALDNPEKFASEQEILPGVKLQAVKLPFAAGKALVKAAMKGKKGKPGPMSQPPNPWN